MFGRPGHVRSQCLLDDLSFGASKPSGAADDRAVRDHADLSQPGFETLRPDRVGVSVELKHLRRVEPHIVRRQVAREDALADPGADASRLVRVPLTRPAMERASGKDLAVDDEGGSAVGARRLRLEHQAGRRNDRERRVVGGHVDHEGDVVPRVGVGPDGSEL